MLNRLIEILHWGVFFVGAFFLFAIIQGGVLFTDDGMGYLVVLLIILSIPGVIWYLVKGKFYFLPWSYKNDIGLRE